MPSTSTRRSRGSRPSAATRGPGSRKCNRTCPPGADECDGLCGVNFQTLTHALAGRHARPHSPGKPNAMLSRAVVLSALPIALLLAIGPAHAQQCPSTPTQGAAIPGPLPVLPFDNWWNTDIRTAPVDLNSQNYLNFVGLTRRLH